MRTFPHPRTLPLLALLAALGAGCAADRQPPQTIVLIVIDTLRRDHLSVYGGATPTPHIDALAARGAALEAHASFHQTTMSMGALFTGRTPSMESGDRQRSLAWRPNSWCGMARFVEGKEPHACLPPSLPTLGERMQAQGYATVGIVSNPLLFGAAGFARGFDQWREVGPERRLGNDPVESARIRQAATVNAAVVEALGHVPADGPLFLYVHYLDVHDWNLRDLEYAEAVAAMDSAIGDLLAELTERGLLEDAAIVLTSDHGETLGEPLFVKPAPKHAGNPSTWTVLDVPLIVAGRGVSSLPPFVRTQDLHAFLVGLAGGSLPARAPDVAADELLVTERLFLTYRRGRYKSSWSRVDDAFYLIDLESDPLETLDVAASHPEVVKAHRARMGALVDALAAPDARLDDLPEELLKRLRSLGYMQRPGDPQN